MCQARGLIQPETVLRGQPARMTSAYSGQHDPFAEFPQQFPYESQSRGLVSQPWLHGHVQQLPGTGFAALDVALESPEVVVAAHQQSLWGATEQEAPELTVTVEAEVTQQEREAESEEPTGELPASFPPSPGALQQDLPLSREEELAIFGYPQEPLTDGEVELLGDYADHGVADLDAGANNGIEAAAAEPDMSQVHEELASTAAPLSFEEYFESLDQTFPADIDFDNLELLVVTPSSNVDESAFRGT